MSFSAEWEQSYRNNTNMSIWPWSDLVSYVMRHLRPKPGARVLELGCGAGANIPLFIALESDYSAIEGSATIVEKLKGRYPQVADRIRCGDFTRSIPFAGPFDLVVDRSAVTHNSTASIRAALGLVRERLPPGGMFIGIDWFSTVHGDFRRGEPGDDPFTRVAYPAGQFHGVGPVHFADEPHLRDLFSGFELKVLEHKIVQAALPVGDVEPYASWNLIATKR